MARPSWRRRPSGPPRPTSMRSSSVSWPCWSPRSGGTPSGSCAAGPRLPGARRVRPGVGPDHDHGGHGRHRRPDPGHRPAPATSERTPSWSPTGPASPAGRRSAARCGCATPGPAGCCCSTRAPRAWPRDARAAWSRADRPGRVLPGRRVPESRAAGPGRRDDRRGRAGHTRQARPGGGAGRGCRHPPAGASSAARLPRPRTDRDVLSIARSGTPTG